MTKLWGPVVWSFFHIFAQQINENFFKDNTKECLKIIQNICSTLPCPLCSEHAIQYLKSKNFMNITTKNQLIQFLFNFHNNVNIRTNKKLESISHLEIYKRGKILKITNIMVKQLNKPLKNDNFTLGLFKSFSANEAYKFIYNNKNNFIIL